MLTKQYYCPIIIVLENVLFLFIFIRQISIYLISHYYSATLAELEERMFPHWANPDSV